MGAFEATESIRIFAILIQSNENGCLMIHLWCMHTTNVNLWYIFKEWQEKAYLIDRWCFLPWDSFIQAVILEEVRFVAWNLVYIFIRWKPTRRLNLPWMVICYCWKDFILSVRSEYNHLFYKCLFPLWRRLIDRTKLFTCQSVYRADGSWWLTV